MVIQSNTKFSAKDERKRERKTNVRECIAGKDRLVKKGIKKIKSEKGVKIGE